MLVNVEKHKQSYCSLQIKPHLLWLKDLLHLVHEHLVHDGHAV